jgi:hypothetical protein
MGVEIMETLEFLAGFTLGSLLGFVVAWIVYQNIDREGKGQIDYKSGSFWNVVIRGKP